MNSRSKRESGAKSKKDRCRSCMLSLFVGLPIYWFSLTTEVHYWPPSILRKRKDTEGKVIQTITYTWAYTESLYTLPGPHGNLWPKRHLINRLYYLEEHGKPQRELTFLRDGIWNMTDWLPVDNTQSVPQHGCHANGTMPWACVTSQLRDITSVRALRWQSEQKSAEICRVLMLIHLILAMTGSDWRPALFTEIT